MDNFDKYIHPELIILVAVLYFLGMGIKVSSVKDKYIPIILGASGIVMSTLFSVATGGFTAMQIFDGITQGILCAGCAVYVDQIKKQGKK